MAEHLPIPQGPLCEVIRTMYRLPQEFESEVQGIAAKRKLDVSVWKGLETAQKEGDEDTVLSDYSYASSGKRRGSVQSDISGATPDFGSAEPNRCGNERVERWVAEFGPGGVLENAGPVYLRLPTYVMTESSFEQAFPGGEFVDSAGGSKGCATRPATRN